jgi:hypothetical protein
MVQVWVMQNDSILADWATGFGGYAFRVRIRRDSLSGTVRLSSDERPFSSEELGVTGNREACRSSRGVSIKPPQARRVGYRSPA